jgi:hypothetical protein
MGKRLLVDMSLIERVVMASSEVAPDQHLACVELLGQALDDEAQNPAGPPLLTLLSP